VSGVPRFAAIDDDGDFFCFILPPRLALTAF
jgi:hypothetical protein